MLHKAKKSLGQNFLKSKGALLAMCKAGELTGNDIVLEIGPGKGALTEYLLKEAKKVIAVEKDYDLAIFLSEKFKKEVVDGKLVLVQGDILEKDPSIYGLKDGKYKLIANIPYNITGAIFKKFLSGPVKPSIMTLLVQKEVAERVVARDKKESILSISVKVYGIPKYITKVSKKYFSPSPKVDSAIIQITSISNKLFKNKELESWFFQILKAGFAHKRKVLKSNLNIIAKTEDINQVFEKLQINGKSRAENIEIGTWVKLASELSVENSKNFQKVI